MAKMKKAVLFIVEGITDELTFESIIPNFVNNDEVKFHLVNGDITTAEGVNINNIKNRVTEQIKLFLSSSRYEKSDILKVVHLIDTDGAFISDEAVLYKDDAPHLEYSLDKMETKHVIKTQQRNANKAAALNRLSTEKQIFHIDYEIYYFSRNLEHVLHNIAEDLNSRKKQELAEDFSDTYYKKPVAFLEFINTPEFAVNGNYKETWDFIKQGTNSLHRHCNFHLFFHAYDAATDNK